MDFISQTAATSYLDAGGSVHLRVYLTDGNNIVERITDGNGWQTGGFAQPGEKVSATCWYVGGQAFIRVYCTSKGVTTEWCSDGGGAWYKGAYSDS